MTTGTRLLAGRYLLTDRLGQGGMGVVWRATDQELGRSVAVKELLLPDHLSPAERANAARRAMREARAAALLRHPSIVAVHDVVMDEGRPCIVMDLLSGDSLDRVTKRGDPLPPVQVARIGLEVLDALRLAHARGVLHRDIKPANVFLRDDGRAVLTDFGIAAVEGEATLTASGALMGTPAFMAPEQVRHDAMGPAADLWSLGATLYALVEGRVPFARESLMGMLTAVLTEPPEPPRKAGPLAPVLLALLTKEPALRLNAVGLERALSAVAAGSPPPPLPVVPLPPGPPPARRRGRALPVVALLALTALVATLAVVLWPKGSGNVAPPPAKATTGGPAAVPPPKYSEVGDPCTIRGLDQRVRALVKRPAPVAGTPKPNTRECDWVDSVSDGPRNALKVVWKISPTVAEAGRYVREERAKYGREDYEPIFEPGLGGVDEQFGYEEQGTEPSATVVFRQSNRVIEVRYGTDQSGRYKQQRDGATKAAQWVRDALPPR